MLIEDDILLSLLWEEIEKTENPVVYVDTEFTRKANCYYPMLSLVQIAFEQQVFVVDILAIKALNLNTPHLENILFSKKVLKVFHGCTQDLDAIFGFFGKFPNPIFDTQVANMFCNYDNRHVSYAELVKNTANEVLNKKEMKRTNWSERPLSKKQIKYAEEDVLHLEKIYFHQKAELLQNNTYDWFAEEMCKLVDIEVHIPFEELKKVKADKDFRIWNSLFEWSEITGIALTEDNLKLSWLKTVHDTVFQNIMQHAQIEMTREDALLLKSILKKNELPDQIENTVRLLHEETLVDLSMILLHRRCKELNISTRLIGQKKYITYIIQGRPSPLSVGWRLDAFGKILSDLLEGKIELSVTVQRTGESVRELAIVLKQKVELT